MNFKRIILENLGTIQWLFTWLILVGMVIAGYYLVPITLEKLEAMRQLGIGGIALSLHLFPLGAITLISSGLISLIWQFRVIKKYNTNCRGNRSSQSKSICGKTVR